MSVAQVRPVLLKLANEYDNLSGIFEEELPIFKGLFLQAIDSAIKMREIYDLDGVDIDAERESIESLIDGMLNLRDAMNQCKVSLTNNDLKLDKQFTKAQKKLINNFDSLIQAIDSMEDKTNELLNYT